MGCTGCTGACMHAFMHSTNGGRSMSHCNTHVPPFPSSSSFFFLLLSSVLCFPLLPSFLPTFTRQLQLDKGRNTMSAWATTSSIPSWNERQAAIATAGRGATITASATTDREPESPAPRIRVGYLRGTDVIESSSSSFKVSSNSTPGSSPQVLRGPKLNGKMNLTYDSNHSSNHPRHLST